MTVRVGGVEGQTRVGLLEYDAATGRVLLLRGDVVRLVAHRCGGTRRACSHEAGITVGEVGSGHYQTGGLWQDAGGWRHGQRRAPPGERDAGQPAVLRRRPPLRRRRSDGTCWCSTSPTWTSPATPWWACSIPTRPATIRCWRRRSGPSTRRCSRGAWTTTSRPSAGSCPTPHWSSAPTTASKATAGGGIPTRCCARRACSARTASGGGRPGKNSRAVPLFTRRRDLRQLHALQGRHRHRRPTGAR